jgi:hypothetical protein
MSRLLELQKMALDKVMADDPTPMSATSCYANSCIRRGPPVHRENAMAAILPRRAGVLSGRGPSGAGRGGRGR